MRKLLILCLLLSALAVSAQSALPGEGGAGPNTGPTETSPAIPDTTGLLSAQKTDTASLEKTWVKEVKWPVLDTLLKRDSDTTYIINFWATWCRPCVAELPHFEELNRNYARQKVRVILVSMDFVKDMEDRVIPFVKRMKLANTVWLLNEPDANSWIEKVDPGWSGALPATLILNPARTKRAFFEKALDYETLVRELSYFIEY